MQEMPQSGNELAEPPQYVGYTRPKIVGGTPEQVLALADAYRGFQNAFLIDAVLFVLVWVAVGATGGDNSIDWILGVGSLCIAVVSALVSYRPSRSYAIALGRSPRAGLGICIALGVQSIFCFGMLGYAAVSNRIITELKRYGIRIGFMGVRDEDLQTAIHQMNFSAVPSPPSDPSLPPPPAG